MNKFAPFLLSVVFCGYTHMVQAADDLSELQAIEALQKRADQLAFGEVGSNDYSLAKARTWLDLALSEYHQKDTSGIVPAATAQAKRLIEALEQNETNISNETQRDVEGTEIVRQDLWDKIAKMKSQTQDCIPSKLAEAEVYLVWTGHEKMEAGWTHGEPYARIAENLIYEAQVSVTNCLAALTPAGKNAIEALAIKDVEKFSLLSDTTFKFGTDFFIEDAEAKLDKLVGTVKGWKQLHAIELTGHADHLRRDGNLKKNQELSERRAEAIKRYLVSKGIAENKIRAVGAGSSKPLVTCDDKAPRPVQIACLQPNRRVEIMLRGEK